MAGTTTKSFDDLGLAGAIRDTTIQSNKTIDDLETLRVGVCEFVGSATYDPANLVDGAGVTTTVTCTGAALGDFAQASFSLDLQGITLTAYVSAADTVSVRFQNESGGAIDLASGTIRVRTVSPVMTGAASDLTAAKVGYQTGTAIT